LLDDLFHLNAAVTGAVGDTVDQLFLGDGCHMILTSGLNSDGQQTYL